MSFSLVNGGKPRRLSGAEIKALTAERVAARQAKWDAEREQRDAERNYSERVAFYRTDYKRQRFWKGVVYVGSILTAVGLTALASTEAQAILAMVFAIGLASLAVVLSLREDQ